MICKECGARLHPEQAVCFRCGTQQPQAVIPKARRQQMQQQQRQQQAQMQQRQRQQMQQMQMQQQQPVSAPAPQPEKRSHPNTNTLTETLVTGGILLGTLLSVVWLIAMFAGAV